MIHNSDQNKAKSGGGRSELHLRIIFGLLLAVGAFILTWMGGLAFQIFVAFAAVIMFGEYRKICGTALPPLVGFIAFAFVLLNIAAWISKSHETAILLSILAFVALLVWEGLIKRTGWGALGLIYVVLPFFGLVHIRGAGEEGFYATLLLFACVWGADTMAYVVGKNLGGPKLVPKISPGKTWSGFFGGLIGGILIGWLVMKISGYSVKPAFLLVAGVLVIISQVGDLAESMLKRRFNVKDSGTIIPGHGGVLDRVDGLVFAAVVAWILSLILANVWIDSWTWEPAIALMSFIGTQ